MRPVLHRSHEDDFEQTIPHPLLLVIVARVLDFSFCYYSGDMTPYLAIYYVAIPRQILGVVLFILAVTQALRQSINMYKATKHWQPNKYMALLVRDGILDFFLYVSLLFFYHSPSSILAPPPSLVFCPSSIRIKANNSAEFL